ncbi:hypothetical protein ACNPNP_19635 [Microbacterium sp. AGC85]
MNTTTDLAPIGLQTTPDGMSPCAACGIPTTGATTAYPVLSRMITTAGGERADTMATGASVDLPTCDDCQDIGDVTARILADHPGLIRALGTVASWRLCAALYALDALGQRLPDPDISPERLAALVHRLADPGALVTYSRRFSPVWETGTSAKRSARARWSAVPPDALAECRRGAVDWLADARPPRSLPHPTGEWCQWCGTSTALGRRASEAWFGDLCGTCASVKSNGGDTYTALWDAVDPDRAIRRRSMSPPDLDGVRPWSRTGGGDGMPCSHHGGIDALRDRVAFLVTGA